MLDGVLVALVAAACFEWAYVVQAEQARKESGELELRLSLMTRLARNWRWLAGLALTGAGALLQVWALTLAPLTVVQPTLAAGLLALPFLARFRLGERLRLTDQIGIGAIVAGVSMFAIFGPTEVGDNPAGAELGIVLGLLALTMAAPFALRSRGLPPQLSVAGAAAGDAAAALCLQARRRRAQRRPPADRRRVAGRWRRVRPARPDRGDERAAAAAGDADRAGGRRRPGAHPGRRRARLPRRDVERHAGRRRAAGGGDAGRHGGRGAAGASHSVEDIVAAEPLEDHLGGGG